MIDIQDLLKRPIIRKDKGTEWENKMTDDELFKLENQMLEDCKEKGIKGFPDVSVALLSKTIDITILYDIFKLG